MKKEKIIIKPTHITRGGSTIARPHDNTSKRKLLTKDTMRPFSDRAIKNV